MSFYQSNSLPKQWQWKPGIYFRQDGSVYKLLHWTKAMGLAKVASGLSDYKNEVLVAVSFSAYRVRKDGREYQRTSKKAEAARRRNAAQGRLAGIKSNLRNLIKHEIHDPIYQELLAKNVDYTLQAIQAQIDWEWRKRKENSK